MQKLFIEKVKTDDKGFFLSSSPIDATEEDIVQFKSRPCDHSLHVDKLCYDKEGWPYDLRYCGICNTFLGVI